MIKSNQIDFTMLYHPNSPYYQQFLNMGASKARAGANSNASQPVPAAASAAQAKAANMEK